MKSYGQWCALAKALDVVGERWSLLIVRELLDGPKRYTDLQEGIPGISTDVLAARLKDLEDDGVLSRRRLPPPAASKVYELTEMGRGLGPTVASLAKWGLQLLGPRTDDEAFRPQWLATGLRGLLRPDRAKDVALDIDFELCEPRERSNGGEPRERSNGGEPRERSNGGEPRERSNGAQGEVVRIRVDGGRLHSVAEPDVAPDLVVRADLVTLAALADGSLAASAAVADGRLELEGSDDAIALYGRLFPQPRPA